MGSEHVELKQLVVRQDQVSRRLAALREEMSALGKRMTADQKELQQINESIEKLKLATAAVVVSEHAILRYLERVKGVDIEATKKEILPEKVHEQIKVLGNGVFPAGSHSCKVRDGVVITVLTKEEAE
jgi:chromosome segregation ATPase